MAKTVAETIKEITRRHLEENNGLLFGQALTAVGWVNNTVPDCKNIIEFPMSDVSNMGIACGAAITGKRPIIVIRFHDFMWLNSSTLINYAAKSKEIFGTATPIFVRALAQEKAGCVHSGVLHGIFMHMPGLRVCSPMTPKEYEKVWDDFMSYDDPMFVSEHRGSFQNKNELPDIVIDDADITIYAISLARFNAVRAAEILKQRGIKCNVIHIMRLKPLVITERLLRPLERSGAGIVVDAGFEIAGASQSIAYSLMSKTGFPVKALGLHDKSVGVASGTENVTPDAHRIARVVAEIYEEKTNNAKISLL